MADQVIDRLVSSLASGLMGKDEFIDAVEGQARVMKPANATPVPSPTTLSDARSAARLRNT
jgi:hypothetical protein